MNKAARNSSPECLPIKVLGQRAPIQVSNSRSHNGIRQGNQHAHYRPADACLRYFASSRSKSLSAAMPGPLVNPAAIAAFMASICSSACFCWFSWRRTPARTTSLTFLCCPDSTWSRTKALKWARHCEVTCYRRLRSPRQALRRALSLEGNNSKHGSIKCTK